MQRSRVVFYLCAAVSWFLLGPILWKVDSRLIYWGSWVVWGIAVVAIQDVLAKKYHWKKGKEDAM